MKKKFSLLQFNKTPSQTVICKLPGKKGEEEKEMKDSIDQKKQQQQNAYTNAINKLFMYI